jgi:hypothetical protein
VVSCEWDPPVSIPVCLKPAAASWGRVVSSLTFLAWSAPLSFLRPSRRGHRYGNRLPRKTPTDRFHPPKSVSVLGIRTLGAAIVCSPRGLVAAVIRTVEHTERDETRERENGGSTAARRNHQGGFQAARNLLSPHRNPLHRVRSAAERGWSLAAAADLTVRHWCRPQSHSVALHESREGCHRDSTGGERRMRWQGSGNFSLMCMAPTRAALHREQEDSGCKSR